MRFHLVDLTGVMKRLERGDPITARTHLIFTRTGHMVGYWQRRPSPDSEG
jgi:hypothetical protein